MQPNQVVFYRGIAHEFVRAGEMHMKGWTQVRIPATQQLVWLPTVALGE